jgi:hypothetical protein
MRHLSFLLLGAVLGCGGGGGADSGPTPVDAPASADAPTSADAPPATDAPASIDAPSTVDAAGAAVVLSDVNVYANCKPLVPPDPILAFWTASVSGAGGSAATLVSARLVITGSRTVTQNLTVDMPVIPLSGGSGSAMQRKVAADTNPGLVCGELCGGATFTLDLEYDVLGARLPAHAEGPFSCAL